MTINYSTPQPTSIQSVASTVVLVTANQLLVESRCQLTTAVGDFTLDLHQLIICAKNSMTLQ